MKIDLCQTPPTAQAIAEAREACTRTLASLAVREKRMYLACIGLTLLGVVVLATLWVADIVPLFVLEVTVATAVLLLVLGALVIAWVMFARPDALLLVASFAAGWGWWAVVAAWMKEGQVGFLAMEVVFVVLTMGMVATQTIDWLHDTLIEAARERTGQDRLALAPILLVHCPDTLQWCEDDETLRDYQSAVAAQQRSLTEGEYAAMRDWIETRQSRLRVQQRAAREQAACEALRQPAAA